MAKAELKRHPLNQSKFFRLKTRPKLAAVFGLSETALQAVVDMKRPYSGRQIESKKNGKVKTRDIQEPRGALRPIYDRVKALLSRIAPPDFLFCPVKRRSYVDNAARHIGAKQVRTLDVKTYFPSTPQHRVYWFFREVMECEKDIAAILAKILTVNGHLATGSTASPILSFFAFYDMWHNISDIVKAAGCKLSVYMDDVSISGEVVRGLVVWEVQKQIHSRGLKYHKERNFKGGIAEVTGVLLRDGKTLIPNRQHLKAHLLRAELRQSVDPKRTLTIAQSLIGLQSQRKQIESNQGHCLARLLSSD